MGSHLVVMFIQWEEGSNAENGQDEQLKLSCSHRFNARAVIRGC